ncbi:MAG TPA: hypothetical protein VM529_10090 [Gemmata sp.]|nr:hypothetical protein [Gemmata sp.]
MNTKTPRKLKNPQPCRYCGFVSDAHAHERGLMGVSDYECRNVEECGDRIRAGKIAKGVPLNDASDTPF